MTFVINGTTGATQSASFDSASTFGFKNRIINGAMTIDQRNAGASVTGNDGVFSVDRWVSYVSASSKFTMQQSSTAPAGFKNSVVITSSASTSLGAGDYYVFQQAIEGYNVADLGFGASGAATVTVSFWVRSSLTGTFGGSLKNTATGANRSYPFTYTISSANTWEQKTVTVAGDTAGTWGTTNSSGLCVCFGLGVGTTYSGTANAWAGSNYLSATGATSVVGTSGATFYITGVQLEKSSTATSFDFRSYGTELALCQRYYQKSYNTLIAPGTATDTGLVENGVGGAVPTTGTIEATTTFKVTMRGSATVTVYDRGANSGKVSRLYPGVSSTDNQNAGVQWASENGFGLSGSGVNAACFGYQYVASAEL